MADLLRWIEQILNAVVGWIFSPSWLPPKDFQFFRWLVVPGYGYGFVLVLCGVLELIRPQVRRPWGRATLLSSTYLIFAGKIGFYALVITPLLRKGWVGLGLPSLHLDQTLPTALYIPIALLVITFIGYWSHRLMHRIPLLWNIHKVHHSVVNLNCTSVYHGHFLELLLHTPLMVMATLALGTELVAPFGIIWVTLDVLGHSNVRIDLGWLTYLVSTPQAHRVHHSIDPAHYNKNFSNQIMLWDHVFGTFHHDPARPPNSFGLDEPVPPGFIKQQILPLVWVARAIKATWAQKRSPPV